MEGLQLHEAAHQQHHQRGRGQQNQLARAHESEELVVAVGGHDIVVAHLLDGRLGVRHVARTQVGPHVAAHQTSGFLLHGVLVVEAALQISEKGQHAQEGEADEAQHAALLEHEHLRGHEQHHVEAEAGHVVNHQPRHHRHLVGDPLQLTLGDQAVEPDAERQHVLFQHHAQLALHLLLHHGAKVTSQQEAQHVAREQQRQLGSVDHTIRIGKAKTKCNNHPPR